MKVSDEIKQQAYEYHVNRYLAAKVITPQNLETNTFRLLQQIKNNKDHIKRTYQIYEQEINYSDRIKILSNMKNDSRTKYYLDRKY